MKLNNMDDLNKHIESAKMKDGINELTPKEITKTADGTNVASFDYYSGIKYARQNGLKQSGMVKEGQFVVCCGDVMVVVKETDYPHINRSTLD